MGANRHDSHMHIQTWASRHPRCRSSSAAAPEAEATAGGAMGTGSCCCCCGCSTPLPSDVATSEDGANSSSWPHRPRAHCPTRSSMDRPTATGVSGPMLPCPVRSCRTRSISAAVLPAGCCSCSVEAAGPGPYGGRKRCQGGGPDSIAASIGRCRLRRRVGEEVAGFKALRGPASSPSWWASRSL